MERDVIALQLDVKGGIETERVEKWNRKSPPYRSTCRDDEDMQNNKGNTHELKKIKC